MTALGWVAAGVLVVSTGSNVLGNVSLATMLTSALLGSSYAALAMYAGKHRDRRWRRCCSRGPGSRAWPDAARRRADPACRARRQASCSPGRSIHCSLRVFRPLYAMMLVSALT